MTANFEAVERGQSFLDDVAESMLKRTPTAVKRATANADAPTATTHQANTGNAPADRASGASEARPLNVIGLHDFMATVLPFAKQSCRRG